MTRRWVGIALAVALATAPGLRAQRVEFGAALWGAGSNARSVYPGGVEALTGPVVGFDLRVARGGLGLRLGYGQGSLKGDTAGPAQRDYVDGYVHLTAAPLRSVELGLGPYARAYNTDAGIQRWLFWQLRGRYEEDILPATVRGYAELWIGLTGSANVAEGFNGSRGGAVGLLWRILELRGSPVTLRLSYAIDEARLGDGARRETVERTNIALGIGRH